MKPAFRCGLAAVLLVVSVCAPTALRAQAPAYEVTREFGVRIPMRDGVGLTANVFRPEAEGKFPVILVRTPYDAAQPNYSAAGAYWASRVHD